MTYKVEPTQHERVMREDDSIVSKTDLKGRMTHCNRVFIEFSGFQESELLGEQHNFVRHPDMPRGDRHHQRQPRQGRGGGWLSWQASPLELAATLRKVPA